MTKIQILGSGCDKCRKLAANVKLAAERIDLPCEIEKIEDINQITAFGVMMTPALAVNGKIVSSGKVSTPEEIVGFLSAPACDCGGQCASPETKTTESSCCCGTPAESAAPCCCGGDGKKKIMTIVLLLIVVASIVFMIIRRIADHTSPAAPSAETELVTSANAE
ncbi:thioredoxin family protein [uncultured Victivallis sp.]|uniref:thioredoxin family protein n=1 Tax=uncultured Victivallis sp. TaxID=354118 RepID=UPI0025F63B9E|nr:thioredoxin family protein [uncultured Victivallis sp.]